MMGTSSLESCNNGTLITTSPLRNSTETTKIEDNVSSNDPSLEELCIIFEIPKEVCSCGLFNGYCSKKKKLKDFTNEHLQKKIYKIEASVKLISALIGIDLYLR